MCSVWAWYVTYSRNQLCNMHSCWCLCRDDLNQNHKDVSPSFWFACCQILKPPERFVEALNFIPLSPLSSSLLSPWQPAWVTQETSEHSSLCPFYQSHLFPPLSTHQHRKETAGESQRRSPRYKSVKGFSWVLPLTWQINNLGACLCAGEGEGLQHE